jgi:hypothetical protein
VVWEASILLFLTVGLGASDSRADNTSTFSVSDCRVGFSQLARRAEQHFGDFVTVTEANGHAFTGQIIAADESGISLLVRGTGPSAVYRRIEDRDGALLQPALDAAKRRPAAYRGQVGDWMNRTFLRWAEPIGKSEPISTEDFLEIKMIQLQELLDLKVKIRDVDLMDYLTYAEGTKTAHQRTGFVSTVREVVELPLAGEKRGPFVGMFVHPDMQARLHELRRQGYRVVVDLTLPATGAAAYLDPATKVIGVTPFTLWHQFEHEVEHSKVNEFLIARAKHIRVEGAGAKEVVLPENIVKTLGHEAVEKQIALASKGLPDRGWDETLAVDAELRSFGWRRFVPRTENFFPYRYAASNRAASLLEIERRTPEQNRMLMRSVVDLAAIRTADFLIRHPILTSIGASYGASQVYGPMKQMIYSEKNGEVFIEDEDGHWTHLTAESAGR